MDFLQAIESAEATLAETIEALEDARAMVAMLEADAKKMKLEVHGMKSFAARQGLGDEQQPIGFDADVVPISAEVEFGASASGPDIALMSRSDAVITVMHTIGDPADRNTIHEHFVDGGRFDSIDDISLTLSGLKRSGRAEKLGRGMWQVAEEALAAR